MKLRFTIRDLFWLTAVVALSVGWWLDASEARKRERNLRSLVQLFPMNDVEFFDPPIPTDNVWKNVAPKAQIIIHPHLAKP